MYKPKLKTIRQNVIFFQDNYDPDSNEIWEQTEADKNMYILGYYEGEFFMRNDNGHFWKDNEAVLISEMGFTKNQISEIKKILAN